MAVALNNPADVETRGAATDHQSLRLWLRLLACTNLIETRVRQRLQTVFGTTLPRFDLMAQLERAPGGLRMGDLSRRMMVTGGNITGIANTLEREGLISRQADAVDRRVYRVRLTREGRRAFEQMAHEHEQWIIELFNGLSDRDKHELAGHLAALKQHLINGTARPTLVESDGHEREDLRRSGLSDLDEPSD
jgi:DNA-binding MarR family transcriptional regulator